jgi:anti-anti-sigma factor
VSVRVRRLEDAESVNVGEVKGRMDAYTSPQILKTIEPRITEETPNLILDFSEVDLLVSSGITTILNLQAKVESVGGELVICSSIPMVQKVFDVMRMAQIFTITESLDDARHHFVRKAGGSSSGS